MKDEKALPIKFLREKEQILSQYILHHEVSDSEVVELAERLDRAVDKAVHLHDGQKRKSGEDYVVHPVRTAMEVSRFGRIVDWASVEAALLHDTLEDTEYDYDSLAAEFPDAAKLVMALTKIKDSREHTYQRLFRFVLQDIRVLLVKIADRLDNLETLGVFSREKQIRIASESAQMYANICRRLCMTDLAERLSEKVGLYLLPEEMERYTKELEAARETLAKPLGQMKAKLAETLPEELAARIEIKWNRFSPEAAGFTDTSAFFAVRVITDTNENAYRALGFVHMAFKAIPGAFTDTISNPRTNGFKAIETLVSYRGRIIPFYFAGRSSDRYNRMGLLSMDIESPTFNLKYLEDLREFLQSSDGNIQDFMRFQKPDAIQVVSPNGDVYALEENATALDFAFAVHNELGLRATGAKINDEPALLDTPLHSGDRVKIETAHTPVCDERYLGWAHSRKALAALRRHLKKVEDDRAATTGRQWLIEAAQSEGLDVAGVESLVAEESRKRGKSATSIYIDICLGAMEISEILTPAPIPKTLSVETLVRFLRPGKGGPERRVRRYDFTDPHIRFCQVCIPLTGDEIEGAPEGGRLNVHRRGCPLVGPGARIPLTWDKSKKAELHDPGPVEMDVETDGAAGAFYSVMWPFKTLEIELNEIRMPGEDNILKLFFAPGSANTLNKLIGSLRKVAHIKSVRLMRNVAAGYSTESAEISSR